TWPAIEMASTAKAWGGLLRTTAPNVVEALGTAASDRFAPIDLHRPDGLWTLVEQQVELGILDREVLEYLSAAERFRAALVPHQRKLIEEPILFLTADEEVRKSATGFVAAMQSLYAAIRTSYEAMSTRAAQSAESIVGQLLALD